MTCLVSYLRSAWSFFPLALSQEKPTREYFSFDLTVWLTCLNWAEQTQRNSTDINPSESERERSQHYCNVVQYHKSVQYFDPLFCQISLYIFITKSKLRQGNESSISIFQEYATLWSTVRRVWWACGRWSEWVVKSSFRTSHRFILCLDGY